MSFTFLDPGRLIDDELELIAPDVRWVDALLASCAHPQCADDPSASAMTGTRITEFLRVAPRGHQPADPSRGWVPSYHFWMHIRANPLPPPIEIAGGITLRIGQTHDLEMYAGHIGYGVYPPARGRHLAERACRLILPLARNHGLRRVWITCNPDNWASRRTCERLGCEMAGIVAVPKDHQLFLRGDREKCRYYLDL